MRFDAAAATMKRKMRTAARCLQAFAFSVFMAGGSIGGMLGFAIGGILNDVASWRYAMLSMVAPGVLLAALILLTVREPRRPETVRAGVSDPPLPVAEAARTLLGSPVFCWMAAGAACFGHFNQARRSVSGGRLDHVPPSEDGTPILMRQQLDLVSGAPVESALPWRWKRASKLRPRGHGWRGARRKR